MKNTNFKSFKSDILNITVMVLIGLVIAVIGYPFLHEGGHIFAAYVVGAEVKEFHLLPIPYVVCNVQSLSIVGQIIIGISGMFLPLIVAILIPKKWYWSWYIRFLLLEISLLAFVISAVTLILPNGVKLNPQDDMLQVLTLWSGSSLSLIILLLLMALFVIVIMLKDRPLRIIYRKFGI